MAAPLLNTVSPMPPHPVGLELFKRVKDATGTDRAVLGFSNGKDSIACWLAMRDHFDIAPYYLEPIPNLRFINEGMDYFERYFGQKIIRVPHPQTFRMLREAVFQPFERLEALDELDVNVASYEEVATEVKDRWGWSHNTLSATGLRYMDSLMRRTAIKQRGPIAAGARKFYPIWDWSIDHMVQQFKAHDIMLPVDYRLFGRSFDGINGHYLRPIKKYYPDDYAKIVELFPMAEAELRRYEKWQNA